jgi:hypothetical protein
MPSVITAGRFTNNGVREADWLAKLPPFTFLRNFSDNGLPSAGGGGAGITDRREWDRTIDGHQDQPNARAAGTRVRLEAVVAPGGDRRPGSLLGGAIRDKRRPDCTGQVRLRVTYAAKPFRLHIAHDDRSRGSGGGLRRRDIEPTLTTRPLWWH